MLSFNPYFRPSAKNLLKNVLFDEIRMPYVEESATFKVKIDIDIEQPEDYEQND